METYDIILGWKLPWTEEPGGLWSTVTELDMTEHVRICARCISG